MEISIIMGIYNCQNYIKESIESILSQTYTNWELIMCDDASNDETYNIAKTYQEKYPEKIVLLKNNTNLGLNKTLNKCLKVAKGKYIARQDGDDISLPKRLETEYNFLENHSEYALVSSKMVRFDENGDWGEYAVVEKPDKINFVKGTPFAHAASMIRRNVINEVNGYTEDTKLLRVEDYHLWFKIYAKGYKGYNINEVLYKTRDDNDAYKRRNFRNRINEVRVRYIGYKMLKIPFCMYIYCLKPICVWLLPKKVYIILHRKKTKNNYNIRRKQ